MAAAPPIGSKRMRVFRVLIGTNAALYRWTGGRVGGKWKMRNPVLLLEHVGRVSGKSRTAPLCYIRDGSAYVVAGSRGGSDETPAWFLNLQAAPDVVVQVGKERLPVHARVVEGAERERLWGLLKDDNPDYATYERQTDRRIPVIAFEPR
jgi:deazaflavin-dependent oxidoreductase (nitroreductase family)